MKNDFGDIHVFVTRQIPEAGIEMLKSAGFKVTLWPHDRPIKTPELIAAAQKANACITLGTDVIDAEFLTNCRHLDIISQFAVGYDNIDLATASLSGITIANAPGAMSNATADVAFGLMIVVSRKMFYLHKTISKGEWKAFQPLANLGFELKHKTLGIFGLGRIGYEMALRCKGAYQMRILYCNRSANLIAERELNAERVAFDELLNRSDVISVHCALTSETSEVFNKTTFSKMKPSSIFINTARGGIHNENDLIEAIERKIIWGAGLDVTNPEPMAADNPLLSMPNVAILPHIGSATKEARHEMSRIAAQNIIEFYKSGKPVYLVSE